MSVHSANERTYDPSGRWRTHTYAHATEVGGVNRTLYIVGDEDTDGSERFMIDEINNLPTIEQRQNGVWNIGELQLPQGALLLGRRAAISTSGHHVLVTPTAGANQLILLEVEYDDSGTLKPVVPVLGPKFIRRIAQPDDSLEVTLLDHAVEFNVAIVLMITRIYIKTGATAASEDVQFTLSTGIPPNDTVFFRENFAASSFPADSEVEINLMPGLEFDPGEQINSSISSETAFTLKYNAASTTPWFALDIQEQIHEDILTETLVLANDLSIAFSNNLELLRPNKDLVLQ